MSNPFSVARLGPAGLDYQFGDEGSREVHLRRYVDSGRRVQLAGPHGAGKSTLLFTLAEELRQRGDRPLVIRCHADRRRLPASLPWRLARSTDLLLDGGECLGLATLRMVAAMCRVLARGLIVTTHHPLALPLSVIEVATSRSQCDAILKGLLSESDEAHYVEEARRLLAVHHGDMRSTLWDLYCLYEEEHGRKVTA